MEVSEEQYESGSSKEGSKVASRARLLGDIGEELVCRWLARNNFLVIDRNYLKPWGELDIVARKNDQIYFIEVKTVSRPERKFPGGPDQIKDGYRPEEQVHEWKQKRMARAIQTYLSEYDMSTAIDFQCDLICVYLDRSTQKAKIERLENIII